MPLQARLFRDGAHVADIRCGGFIAEMSLLTGRRASADVRANDVVETLSWCRTKLANPERLNPNPYLATGPPDDIHV